jgi:hypothetical protein
MNELMFNFKSTVPMADQQALLTRIKRWEGIKMVGQLKPDAKRASTRRICYAYLDDQVDIQVMKTRLAALTEIESVEIPPARYPAPSPVMPDLPNPTRTPVPDREHVRSGV